MKKSITALACATLLAVSLGALTVETSAQTSPQFAGPATAAPTLHKKKAHAKPGAKASAHAHMKAKAKAAHKVKKSKKSKKSGKSKKLKVSKFKARKAKTHKTM